MYIYIYKCSTLKFFDNIFIEDAMPEKAFKYALFQKISDQNLHFEYFQKISLKMNFTHPFYPILIPKTSYVKIFIFCSGGSQKKLMISKNYYYGL